MLPDRGLVEDTDTCRITRITEAKEWEDVNLLSNTAFSSFANYGIPSMSIK